jgi:hypothetical protein
MTDTAIVILAGTETHADTGRLVNGLEAAGEFAAAGDDVRVIFDGAGTEWIPELESGDHDAAPLYDTVSEHVAVCEFCAGAFGVADEVAASDAETLAEHDGHPSVRRLVEEGREVVTF